MSIQNKIIAFNYTSIKDYLSDCLEYKKKTNPKYSLRLMAKMISISPAMLSLVINGKNRLSSKHIPKLSQYLKINEAQSRYLTLLADYETAPEKTKKILENELALIKSQNNKQDLLVNFHMTWKHTFILTSVEFIKNKKDLFNYSNKITGIKEDVFEKYFQDLIDNQLIFCENDSYSIVHNRIIFPNKIRDKIIDNLHYDYYEFSKNLIKNKDYDCRFSATEFITINKSNFSKAKELANNFLDELSTLQEDTEKNKSIIGISLNINLFNQ